ncbi:4'-phosphopantetheinyl transferase [Saccharopolyspora kobensis]|uniref:4'-phosphopantetheinyl transferase n=1 Tax=Saccharopolyspora kobensis TaxID=146035 RepID=A0A1H6DSP2_9PSEU|nr:4'-phosphopantetheinyl transferase superfamily protein [Saccharopolyspora kobensis]SEG88269.1 4'-phosphopantetheinyl transferase [Saccharopolyspora kobensis]SFE02131.1 4'-phosphopantetheinyl transferase [Saccharopolyspora kobensis]
MHDRLIEVAERTWVGAGAIERLPDRAHPADLARTAGMPAWRAREFLAGRSLLRSMLRELYPEAAELEVTASGNGKPHLLGAQGLGVSVSHDSGVVAVCVAPGREVGVDVQGPPEKLERALVRRCLRAYTDEVMQLPSARRALEFAWVWTVQEACVKATGEGIGGRPWAIDVPPGASTGSWGSYRWVSLRGASEVPLSCAFGPAGEEGS